MIERLFAFVFGAAVGSFLNVCIHRLPLGESIAWPGSHCPKCKKPILWYDNIPFVGYLVLRGKCRFCKEKISPRYFIVELLTAGAFLTFFNLYGFSYEFFFYLIFTCGLLVATFVDIQHRIIPDEISIGGMVAGFLLTAIHGFKLTGMRDSLLGIVIGGGIIYLVGFLFDLVYFKLLKRPPIQGETESMGGGDVKLLAMIGAFLGWKSAVLTFFLAPFFGIILGVVNLVAKKDHTVPYGPFLSLAALVSLFWADKIISLIIVTP
jgi:leader peptidase (prepilin peptidase) / N-methyltransferase